jgi:hypothetical protein
MHEPAWKPRPMLPCFGMLQHRAAVLLGAVLIAVAAALAQGSVTITSVHPNTGSIAGGTRLHIQGWGFSTNTGGTGNIIRIGDKFVCDPIPLHCTKHQVACKTRSALLSITEHYSRYGRWNGWTHYLPVSVEVDGQQSKCSPAPGKNCVFRFHQGWFHTPRIYSLSPRAVEEGSLLRVNGRFHSMPFEFEELRAPSMEIPLASVKIANRAAEKQQPGNEPFGQSGTRCALFNQESEEPFEVVLQGDTVSEFTCQVNGPREAGRYNMSVALLGRNMNEMNMGESLAADSVMQADHQGVSFMLHHVAKVTSVVPTRSGLTGGTRLTISGSGFTTDKHLVQVVVGGTRCTVTKASLTHIECVLTPRTASPAHNGSSFAQGDLQPGTRGVRRRMWWNKGKTGIEALRTDAEVFNRSDVDEVEKAFVESERNIQRARGDSTGPHGQYTGWFRAPVSGSYSFLIASDDGARMWYGSFDGSLLTRPAALCRVSSSVWMHVFVCFTSWKTLRGVPRGQCERAVVCFVALLSLRMVVRVVVCLFDHSACLFDKSLRMVVCFVTLCCPCEWSKETRLESQRLAPERHERSSTPSPRW